MSHRLTTLALLAAAVAAAPLAAQDEPARPATAAAWANFDFLPGERLLFADDFSGDRVGNFPRRLELGQGAMELVEWKGARYLRSNDNGYLVITLPEVLPARFTFEADVLPHTGTGWGPPVVTFGIPPKESLTGADALYGYLQDEAAPHYVVFKGDGAGVMKGDKEFTTALPEALAGEPYKLRIMADGNYVKVFANEVRVANVPSANLGRSNKIHIVLNADKDNPAMIGNIRVAAGGRDLYDALSATGRVATQGIYFDTGSDRIRPESGPTLKQIGDMLKAHADLKLTIEGHTDNVGQPAANKTLSEKRAAAVKSYLVGTFGIDAARLQSAGLGDAKPAAPNTTPEGRQQNRRVELVKN